MTDLITRKISIYVFWGLFAGVLVIGLVWPQTNSSLIYVAVSSISILISISSFAFFDARYNKKKMSILLLIGIFLFHPIILPIYIVRSRGWSLGGKWLLHVIIIWVTIFFIVVSIVTALRMNGVLPLNN